MAGDWIRLHRKLLESAVFSDDWLLKLWVWCLLRASYCDRQIGGFTVPAGSFVTGRFAAADELNVSPSKWYRGIHQLASLGMISLSASQERTIVTVCNWATYQSESAVREQQPDSNRTASEQQVNNERTASEQQSDTREEGKEGKDNTPKAPKGASNGYCQSFEEWWSAYPKKSGKEAAFKAWTKAGKQLKVKMVADAKDVAAFLLRLCQAYAAARADQDPQYTLNPKTWLDQGHWDDDQTTWKAAPKAGAPLKQPTLSFEAVLAETRHCPPETMA